MVCDRPHAQRAVRHRQASGGRDHIDPVRLDAQAVDGLNQLQRRVRLQQCRKHRGLVWRQVLDNDDGQARARRNTAQDLDQRRQSAGRCAQRHHMPQRGGFRQVLLTF